MDPGSAPVVGNIYPSVISQDQVVRVAGIDPEIMLVQVQIKTCIGKKMMHRIPDIFKGLPSVCGSNHFYPEQVYFIRIVRGYTNIPEGPSKPGIYMKRVSMGPGPAIPQVIRPVELCSDYPTFQGIGRGPIVHQRIERIGWKGGDGQTDPADIFP
jgi:hypothetical protein